MKQFNLKEYLENPERKVVTRDGHEVRIICANKMNSQTPIVALIKEGGGRYDEPYEVSYSYYGNGHLLCNEKDPYDLFFADEDDARKHEGWMSLYYNVSGDPMGGPIYRTEQIAIKNAAKDGIHYITTIKVEWEK